MLTKRDFLGEEYYIWAQQSYDEIRQRVNSRGKFKPDVYDRVEMAMDKIFERFFKEILNGR